MRLEAIAMTLVACTHAAPHPIGAVAPPPVKAMLRPLLVLAKTNEKSEAFLLACARVEPGKRTEIVNADTCAPLLASAALELVTAGNKRIPVTVVRAGRAPTCPYEGEETTPTIELGNVPTELALPAIVVGRGMSDAGPIDDATLAAIANAQPKHRGKAHGAVEDGPNVFTAIDLDGDGRNEVILEQAGTLFMLVGPDGATIATVGCYLG